MDMRGTAIAEGDLLVISIRKPLPSSRFNNASDQTAGLASELLLGRYAVPETTDTSSLLAKHESGLFQELRGTLSKLDHHRGDLFNQLIMPECFGLVKTIGHRMAYDAAVAAQVDPVLVDLFVASTVKQNSAWYVEQGLSRARQNAMESEAIAAVFPRLEEFLEQMDVEPYISAPMMKDEMWEDYVQELPEFSAAVEV
jgi:acyl-CoA oxidase